MLKGNNSKNNQDHSSSGIVKHTRFGPDNHNFIDKPIEALNIYPKDASVNSLENLEPKYSLSQQDVVILQNRQRPYEGSLTNSDDDEVEQLIKRPSVLSELWKEFKEKRARRFRRPSKIADYFNSVKISMRERRESRRKRLSRTSSVYVSGSSSENDEMFIVRRRRSSEKSIESLDQSRELPRTRNAGQSTESFENFRLRYGSRESYFVHVNDETSQESLQEGVQSKLFNTHPQSKNTVNTAASIKPGKNVIQSEDDFIVQKRISTDPSFIEPTEASLYSSQRLSSTASIKPRKKSGFSFKSRKRSST